MNSCNSKHKIKHLVTINLPQTGAFMYFCVQFSVVLTSCQYWVKILGEVTLEGIQLGNTDNTTINDSWISHRGISQLYLACLFFLTQPFCIQTKYSTTELQPFTQGNQLDQCFSTLRTLSYVEFNSQNSQHNSVN